jgi:carbon-monoxide dehydrogenase medium subunit
MALGATMTIIGPKGERKLAVEDLFAGYYETVLEKDELISEVYVPSQGTKKAAYFKVTTGSADDWPALGVAAVIEGDGKAIKSACIVASAATDKATRLKTAEALLNGKTVTDDLLKQAGDAAVAECEFIADVRGSVPYKRELMRVYVRRAIRAALDGKDGAH